MYSPPPFSAPRHALSYEDPARVRHTGTVPGLAARYARMAGVTARVTAGQGARPAEIGSVGDFPRLRYMGSKYRLARHLAEVFTELGGATALDAFSGSGVVSYLLKTLGYQVTSNDFLTFPSVIARATVVNQDQALTPGDIERICGPPADDRDFVQRTFGGLYFTAE